MTWCGLFALWYSILIRRTNNVTILEGDSFSFINATLNSTTGSNRTDENLTAFINYSQDVNLIFNWFVNGSSATILHMPFDTEGNSLKDYSGQQNNGRVAGSSFRNATEGLGGAMFFDGLEDRVEFNEIAFSDSDSWSVTWYEKKEKDNSERVLFKGFSRSRQYQPP